MHRAVAGGHERDPPQWVEIVGDEIPLMPFKRDEASRALLDAYYASVYGPTEEELGPTLDPEDVYHPDPSVGSGQAFPGKTFRVLEEKEIRKYGKYRTKRLVLET